MGELLKILETAIGIIAIGGVWALAIWTILGRPNPGFGRRGLDRISPTEKEHLLPARYQGGAPVSSAPMGAADLVYDQDGQVVWDRIWGDFCDLAWAGGPPHRGTLLRAGNEDEVREHPHSYEEVIDELARGLTMVTGWPVWTNCPPGNIGLICPDRDAARWLCTAIAAENIDVHIFNKRTLLLPAGPDFRIEFEIKNVITAVAKTHHYWTEHRMEVEYLRRSR